MAQAFKCDRCGDRFDGEPDRTVELPEAWLRPQRGGETRVLRVASGPGNQLDPIGQGMAIVDLCNSCDGEMRYTFRHVVREAPVSK